NENERIGRSVLPGFTERNARHLAPLRPDICAGAALAEFERSISDAELGVDLHGARLHAQRPCLERWPGVPVYDQHTYTPPGELIGEHQPGWAGSDDQNVSIHVIHVGPLVQTIWSLHFVMAERQIDPGDALAEWGVTGEMC